MNQQIVADDGGPPGPPPDQPSRAAGRSVATLGVAALVAILAIAAPLLMDNYLTLLSSLALVYVIVGMGMVVLLGWSGQFAFMSVAFMQIGAYTGGRLAGVTGIPLEAAILVGLLAAAAIGALLGAVAVRLRRYYLAIVTIAFMFMTGFVVREGGDITGGVRGFSVDPPTVLLLGNTEVSSSTGIYYVGLVLAVLAYLATSRLRRTRLARGWATVNVNETAAQALGINVYMSKLYAFVISAGFFGAAGVWFTFVNQRIYPESFPFHELIFHFLILIVGGVASTTGVAIAAVFLAVVNEYLRGFVGLSEILFGAALLGAVLFMPGGLYSLLTRFTQWRERWT